MGAQHIDANHCFDPFFRRQPFDKLLDRDLPARLAKIFDPPLHHCEVTRYILLAQANESTIVKKGKRGKGDQRGQSAFSRKAMSAIVEEMCDA
jgi:hypothetical protein